MSSIRTLIETLDTQISHLFSGWNLYTTLIASLIVLVITFSWYTWKDPDTHPILLQQQAVPARVRQPGESSVYRSLAAPHGYPLNTGLDVRDPDTPKWNAGRDGDLRDIWRKVVEGTAAGQGEVGKKGKIFTIRGTEEIFEHNLHDLCQEINIIGHELQSCGATRVAVYLPNSAELLLTVFVAAFYGLTPVLLPYRQSHDALKEWLVRTEVDVLIAAAGTVPLAEVAEAAPRLKHVIWVVQAASRHLEWSEVPEGIGGRIGVSVWHEIIEEKKAGADANLPSSQGNGVPPGVVAVWQKKEDDPGEIITYTQANLVAATAALIGSLPPLQRFGHSDLFLPADSLTLTYPLTLTLAALYSNASIALQSVAGTEAEIDLSMKRVAPTVIVASAQSVARYHGNIKQQMTDSWFGIFYRLQSRALAAGHMPNGTFINRPVGRELSAARTTPPGKLRLIFVSERAGTDSPPLSSALLSDLRIYTGARVIYALTAAQVAGALTSTNLYDYRREEGAPTGAHAHFGPPLTSVEIKLVDTATHRTVDGAQPEGEITVRGPAVVGGEARLGVVGSIRDDLTLAYASRRPFR
ncbi:MAG: hypothetical protein M1826_002419 [Phylliscum demangeonii]|nr:MAG: hypothetical protein M1826_002419 [Phylliscum demangeonii]